MISYYLSECAAVSPFIVGELIDSHARRSILHDISLSTRCDGWKDARLLWEFVYMQIRRATNPFRNWLISRWSDRRSAAETTAIVKRNFIIFLEHGHAQAHHCQSLLVWAKAHLETLKSGANFYRLILCVLVMKIATIFIVESHIWF